MSLPLAARRNERVMATVVFVVFSGFAFVIPFLPLYLRELGVSDDGDVALWAGVLIGISPLLAGLLAPVWGHLADRYGHKAMATRALISYVLILGLSALVTNVTQLFVLRAAVGLFGGIGPLALVMASSSAARGEAGRAIGVMQAAQILAAAVGPLAGGLLAATVGIRATFVITAFLCAFALLVLQLYYQDGAGYGLPDSAPEATKGRVRLGPLVPLMVILFLVNFVGRSFTPVLLLQIEGLGVSPAQTALATGLLVSLYSVAAALSAASLGRAARVLSPRWLLLASVCAAAVLLIPIARAGSFVVLLVLATAVGLAFGGALTLSYTIGDLLAPAGHRGAAFGWFTGAALLGGALSPPIAGFLVRWDLRGIYYLDVVLFAVAAAVVLCARLPSRPLAAGAD